MKINYRARSAGLVATLGAVVVALACCSGGTDGASAGGSSNDDFVSTDSTTGKLVLTVVDKDMSVSATSGFGIKVTDAQGRGVPNIRVACDSEEGVAILEPVTGTELTNSNGDMSGVIGCAAPGSYQFACRLNVGANKRELVDVICRPPVPTGFTGFPGAGGGGLGGGADDDDDGDVRIKSASYIDDGQLSSDAAATFSIDVVQDICSDSVGAGTPTPTPELEPFYDTGVRVTVQNNTNQIVTCTSATYRVANAGSLANSGTNFVSDAIALQGEANEIDSNGGESSFVFLVFDVTSSGKNFVGSSDPIPNGYGFKAVTLTLNCENDSGDDFTITSTKTLSFDNFDRCE